MMQEPAPPGPFFENTAKSKIERYENTEVTKGAENVLFAQPAKMVLVKHCRRFDTIWNLR